jgi:hypothetical protein
MGYIVIDIGMLYKPIAYRLLEFFGYTRQLGTSQKATLRVSIVPFFS